MSLLNRLTAFFGDHGLRVAIAGIGPDDDATLAVSSSEVDFVASLQADKDCVVLSVTGELSLTRPAVHGGRSYATVGRRVWDAAAGGWPRAFTAGETVDLPFIVDGLDFSRAAAELGHGNVAEALRDRGTAAVLRVLVDVKGTPVDPRVELPVVLRPA